MAGEILERVGPEGIVAEDDGEAADNGDFGGVVLMRDLVAQRKGHGRLAGPFTFVPSTS